MKTLAPLFLILALFLPAVAEEPPALDPAKFRDTGRPGTNLFGAILYADEFNPLTGQARGNVYIDGSAVNATNPKFPELVYAQEISLDLAKGEVILKGWPILAWSQGMVVKAASAETIMKLTESSYEARGPTQISLDLKALKALKKTLTDKKK